MTASEHTELLRRDICQALLNAFPMDDKQADAYAAVAAKVALPDGAEPVPVAWPEGDDALAQLCEDFQTGSVAFANEPDVFCHLIEFTPEQLRRFVAKHPPFASPTGMGVTEEQVERACAVMNPGLFSDDETERHLAASPFKVDVRQKMVRDIASAALTAALRPTSETTK